MGADAAIQADDRLRSSKEQCFTVPAAVVRRRRVGGGNRGGERRKSGQGRVRGVVIEQARRCPGTDLDLADQFVRNLGHFRSSKLLSHTCTALCVCPSVFGERKKKSAFHGNPLLFQR